MTRNELLCRVSSAELSEWMLYDSIEPFGQHTQYVGPAITTAMIANVNRSKGTQPVSPEKFMPVFGSRKEQSVDEQIQIAAMITAAFSPEG